MDLSPPTPSYNQVEGYFLYMEKYLTLPSVHGARMTEGSPYFFLIYDVSPYARLPYADLPLSDHHMSQLTIVNLPWEHAVLQGKVSMREGACEVMLC